MGFVLADREGWVRPPTGEDGGGSPFRSTVVLNDFANLRRAVNEAEADFFMWEHFTSKKFYDAGEIKRVGEIYTPWSSWKIVASTALTGTGGGGALDGRVKDLFGKLDQGIAHFNENQEEAVRHISTELGYSEADAREWLKTVRFPGRTEGVRAEVVEGCVDVLRKAAVLRAGKGMQPKEMIIGS